MRFYGNLTKVDEEQRMVWGYASTEAQDAHGETVLKSAIDAALDDYMDFANIREMHQLSAVGTAEEVSVDDKGLYLGAKIVDDVAWGKVTSGVYKGFSIGGKTLARDPDNKKIITKLLLTEISLVDRPSNPEARFDVWKAAGSQEDVSMAARKKITPVQIPAGAASDVIAKAVNDAVAAGAPITVATEAEGKLLKAINDKVEFVVQAQLPLAADAVAKAAETPVEAPADPAVVDETVIAKANEGEPGATVEAETAPAAEVSVDPVAKATAAVDALAGAVAAVGKPDDVTKSMYHVGRFAEYLEGISYLVASAQAEADYEGDKSPVPDKMRDWLKSGAAIFKELAKEEVDEFVESFKAKKSAETGDLAKATIGEITIDLKTVGGEELAKSITDAVNTALAAVTTERDALAKSVTEKDEALTKLAERIEPLTAQVQELAKRFADEPAPAKTAGAFAVSKEDDASGATTVEKSAPSDEDIAKALGAMSEEDRALLLIKASHQLPRPVTYR